MSYLSPIMTNRKPYLQLTAGKNFKSTLGNSGIYQVHLLHGKTELYTTSVHVYFIGKSGTVQSLD